MKKILTGVIAIVMTLGLVGGVAYTLFTDSVTMTGLVLGTATPQLLISVDGNNYYDTISEESIRNWLGRALFSPLLPGEEDWGEFYLKNESNGVSDKLDMNLTGRITAAGGDWSLLYNDIRLKVCIYDELAPNNCDPSQATGNYTLNYWNTHNVTLPGGALTQNTSRHYAVVFSLPSAAGNGLSGKSITGMNIEITGTQVQ